MAGTADLIGTRIPAGFDLRGVEIPVTGAPDAQLRIMHILKPYLLLATVAFAIGFVGYWAIGRATTAMASVQDVGLPQAPVAAPATAPATELPLRSIRHT